MLRIPRVEEQVMDLRAIERLFNEKGFKRMMESNIAHILCRTGKKTSFVLTSKSSEIYTDGSKIVVGLPEEYEGRTYGEIYSMVKACVGHESAHVKWSNFNAIKGYLQEVNNRKISSSLGHSMFNIIEDGRIERLLCEELPGYIKHIQFLNSTLIKKDGNLRDRENVLGNIIGVIHFLAVLGVYPTNYTDLLEEKERGLIESKIHPLVLKGVMTNSYKVVQDVCLEILDLLKDYIPEPQAMPQELIDLLEALAQETYQSSDGQDGEDRGDLDDLVNMIMQSMQGQRGAGNNSQSSKSPQNSEQNEQGDSNGDSNEKEGAQGTQNNSNEEQEVSNGNEGDENNDKNDKSSNQNGQSSNNEKPSSNQEEQNGTSSGSGSDEACDEENLDGNENGNNGNGSSGVDTDENSEEDKNSGNNGSSSDENNESDDENESSDGDKNSNDDSSNEAKSNEENSDGEKSDEDSDSNEGDESSDDEGSNDNNTGDKKSSENESDESESNEDGSDEENANGSNENDLNGEESDEENANGSSENESDKLNDNDREKSDLLPAHFKDPNADSSSFSYEKQEKDFFENLKQEIEEEAQRAFEKVEKEEQRAKDNESNTFHEGIDINAINSNYSSHRQEPDFEFIYPDYPFSKPQPEFKMKIHGLKKVFEKILKNEEKHYKGQKKGKLDTSRLWRLGLNDTSVFKKKNVVEKSDYSIEILIDTSGSMYDKAKYRNALGTAICIESALTDLEGVEVKTVAFHFDGGTRMLVLKDFKDKYSKTPAAYMSDITDGCNRDGFAIRVTLDDLKKRNSKNKLLIVISDGMPNARPFETSEESIADVKDAVHKGRKDATIVSILINDGPIGEHTKQIFHHMYEEKGSIMVDVYNEPDALMKNIILYLKRMFRN